MVFQIARIWRHALKIPTNKVYCILCINDIEKYYRYKNSEEGKGTSYECFEY